MRRALHRMLVALAGALATLAAAAQPLPGFAELEAAGATIGHIEIRAEDIFDPSTPGEDVALFRLANRLHKQTQPGVIARSLLFRTGEPVRLQAIEETERLLRSRRFLYDVQIRPLAVRDGVVDIEVRTRDTWSLDPGFSAGRAGGANSSGIKLREYNLLGTGISLGFGRSRNVDRTSTEFALSNPRLWGSWVDFDVSTADNSDGHRHTLGIVRPFYALDARWTAGVTLTDDDRVDRLYEAGEEVGGLRHREQRGRVFGGWSEGLVAGRVQRWTAGLAFDDDRFSVDPGYAPPADLPQDRRTVGPFVRWSWIEDRVERELNRNLVGRPEFFSLGLSASVEAARSVRGLGASHDGWRIAAAVARGFEPWARDTLIVGGSFAFDELPSGWRRRAGAQAQYYQPQGPHRLFYAALAADVWTGTDPGDTLLLGGDTGLRGYPLRYQGGTRRVLASVEQRFYSDLFVWQLFRLGGAVFVDVGRAWGGPNDNPVDPGWLADVGAGLRIVNVRAAFSNVLHLDLATPVGARGDIRRLQLLLKTKASF